MTPLLGVLFIPYRTSIIHPTLRHRTRKHRHRRLTCAAAERCRAVASLGGEHPHPSRKARKPILPRAYSASGGPRPRSHRNDRSRLESVPCCVNRGDRPPGDSSGAVSGRSEPWRRTPQPLAHSAKDHPPQSLLSERRPDTAEPTKNRSGAVSGRSEPWRRTPQPPHAQRES